jgi:hypothetical protein
MRYFSEIYRILNNFYDQMINIMKFTINVLFKKKEIQSGLNKQQYQAV